MILDRLENAKLYFTLHSKFAAAFEYLAKTNFASLSTGRNEIAGDAMFCVINRVAGKGRPAARLEVHRKYIDIQVTLSGNEEIGYKAVNQCTNPAGEFDAKKDIGFFTDASESWIATPPGTFAIFYPQDAHAPLAGEGEMFKAIIKIAVE